MRIRNKQLNLIINPKTKKIIQSFVEMDQLKYIYFVYKLMSLFGIVPTYNLTLEKFTFSFRIQLIASVCYVVEVLSAAFLVWILFFQLDFYFKVKTLIVLHVCTEIGNLAFIAEYLTHKLLHRKLWRGMLIKISKLEKKLRHLNSRKRSERAFIALYSYNFAIIAVYCFFVIQYSDLAKRFKPLLFFHFCIGQLFIWSRFGLVMLLTNMYKDLNGILNGPIRTNLLSNVIQTAEIRELGRIYRLLFDAVQDFNAIFGREVFIRVFTMFGTLLTTLNTFSIYLIAENGSYVDFSQIVGSSFYVVCGEPQNDDLYANFSFLQLQFTMFTWLCTRAVSESNNFMETIYDLQQELHFANKDRQELIELLRKVSHFRPQFTADDVFDINAAFLLTLMGGSATYLVVLCQFNLSEKLNN